MNPTSIRNLCIAAIAVAFVAPFSARAQSWEPTKTVEFIVPAGTGVGADQMARVVQSIVAKHNLMKQSMVVSTRQVGPVPRASST